jgi:hypothetical protein
MTDLDRAWAAINALGGTNPTDQESIHWYCRGIDDALKEIEKLGGRDPLTLPTYNSNQPHTAPRHEQS